MTSSTEAKTILLENSHILVKEIISGGAVTPGHVIERYNDSGTMKGRVHSTAAIYGSKLVALENDAEGGTIDTAYAALDTLRFAAVKSGDVVYGLVPASAVAITQGDYLELDGTGCVRKITVSDVADLTGTLTGTLDGVMANVAGSFDATAIAAINKNNANVQAKINGMLPAGIKFPFAVALESVDNSGGGAVARLTYEIV